MQAKAQVGASDSLTPATSVHPDNQGELKSTLPARYFLLLPIALGALILAHAGNSSSQIVVSSGVAILCAAFFSLALMSRGGLGRSVATLRLGPIYALTFALVYGATTILVLNAYAVRNDYAPSLFPVHKELIQGPGIAAASSSLMLLILVVGITYRGIPRKVLRGVTRSFNRFAGAPNNRIELRVGVLAVALLADILLWSLNLLGYVSDATKVFTDASPVSRVLTVVGSVSLVAIFWTAWRWSETKLPAEGVLLLTALLLFTAVGSLGGLKEGVIAPGAVAVFGVAAQRRRFPWASVLAVGLVVVLLVYPLSVQYKDWVSVGGGARRTSSQVVEGRSEFLDQVHLSAADGVKAAQALSARMSRILDYATIQQLTPKQVDFRPPSELLEGVVLGLVPRAIWHNKPVLDTGYQFAIEYYGQSPETMSSSAVTPEGDLWRYGGLVAVLLGAGLFGIFYRLVDAMSELSRDPRYYALAVLLLIPTAKHELDLISFIAGLPATLIAALILVRISRRAR